MVASSVATPTPRARPGHRFAWTDRVRLGYCRICACRAPRTVVCSLRTLPRESPLPSRAPGSIVNGQVSLLGTDQIGRDLAGQILYGSRVSLFVGAATILIAGVFGSALGMLAGYSGSWVDTLIMRVADIQLALPPLVLAILIAGVIGPSVINVVVTLAITRWVLFARVARGSTLSYSTREFVRLGHVLGASNRRILLRHILPSIRTPLLVLASVQFGLVILSEASLSFLGLGVPRSVPSWGQTIAGGQDYLGTAWWISTEPGIALAAIAVATAVFGAQLRDYLIRTCVLCCNRHGHHRRAPTSGIQHPLAELFDSNTHKGDHPMKTTTWRRYGQRLVPVCAGVMLVATAACGSTSTSTTAAQDLTVAGPVPLVDLDPLGANALEDPTQELDQHIFDAVVVRDNGNIEPHLATSWTNPTPDTWDFTIRSGVKFTNGTPLTAADIKWSLQELIKENGPLAPLWSALSTVEAPSATSLVITTTTPVGDMLNNISLLYVVPMNLAGNANFYLHPIGSGPFIVGSFTPNQSIVIVKNPHYWGGAPKLDQITFANITDVSAQVTALENGQIQVTWGLPPDQLQTVESDPNIHVVTKPSLSFYYQWFNSSVKPFNDVRVRQALWYALDLKTMDTAACLATRQRSLRRRLRPRRSALPLNRPTIPSHQSQAVARRGRVSEWILDNDLLFHDLLRGYLRGCTVDDLVLGGHRGDRDRGSRGAGHLGVEPSGAQVEHEPRRKRDRNRERELHQ